MRSVVKVSLAAALVACGAPEAAAPAFEIVVRVTGDPGSPVPDAEITMGGAKAGKTTADGTARLRLRGEEGEVFELAVACPAGHRSPTKPLSVALRRLAVEGRLPQYDVSCPPSRRTVVVAVRAENGPNLPVVHLGKEIARTDASGAAHVLLTASPDETIQLTLSTAEKGAEQLRPQSPVATFAVKDRDEVFVFDQRFGVEKRVVRGPARGPTRLTR